MPPSVGRGSVSSPVIAASIWSSVASGSFRPPWSKNLMPLSGAGLCDALITRARDEVPGPGEVREARRRDVADQTDLHADGAQTRGERAFEHASAPPRVAPDDHAVPRTAEDVAGGTPQSERELGREVLVRDPANAVGPEEPASSGADRERDPSRLHGLHGHA